MLTKKSDLEHERDVLTKQTQDLEEEIKELQERHSNLGIDFITFIENDIESINDKHRVLLEDKNKDFFELKSEYD